MTGGLALRTLPGAPSRWRLSRTICGQIHAGAWSLAFSQPRTSRSTPAAVRRFAAAGFKRRWSIRSPASRPRCVSEVIPKRVDSLVRMQLTDCIHPTQLDETAKGVTHLRSEERVIEPALWFITSRSVGMTLKSPARAPRAPR